MSVDVDVDVTGSGPCIEPRDAFLGLKKRFISMMIKVEEKEKEKELSIT
jgi:hypothetical protein